MAIPPQDGQNLPASGPAEAPAPMLNAIRLMYVGAVIAVVFGVSFALTANSAAVPAGIADPGAFRSGEAFGDVLEGLIAAALWLWMARANKQGRSWARIVSTVFFGVQTFYVTAGFFLLPMAPKVAAILEWAAGLAVLVLIWQGRSGDYYHAVQQAGS